MVLYKDRLLSIVSTLNYYSAVTSDSIVSFFSFSDVRSRLPNLRASSKVSGSFAFNVSGKKNDDATPPSTVMTINMALG